MQTAYSQKPIVFSLDNVNKRYILTIHDLPNEEKPREKLSKLGPASLSTAELLATILGKGTKKEDIISMSSRIMKEYGEKSIMAVRDPKVLVRDLGIPLLHAMQIVACAELGRRFYEKNDSSLPTIRTAQDVFEYVKDMRDLPKEHLRGIYLNAHYKIVHDEIISIGTVDTNIIHPREVFKPALEYGTVGVILVHNHPSGITAASEADILITKQLVEAGRLIGINLIDHVIVTRNAFASIPIEYS
ncbi:MAG: DNA repair protein RadC [Patescibacteria group bacterium]